MSFLLPNSISITGKVEKTTSNSEVKLTSNTPAFYFNQWNRFVIRVMLAQHEVSCPMKLFIPKICTLPVTIIFANFLWMMLFFLSTLSYHLFGMLSNYTGVTCIYQIIYLVPAQMVCSTKECTWIFEKRLWTTLQKLC